MKNAMNMNQQSSKSEENKEIEGFYINTIKQ